MANQDSASEPTPTARRYFAGGINWGEQQKDKEFLAGSYWQLGYRPSTKEREGQRAWGIFHQIRTGDWFAIKGLGGSYDLKVHFVGEVTQIDPNSGRIDLKPLALPLYRGKAPASGAGGRHWFQALLEVKDPKAIKAIFMPPIEPDPPSSLVHPEAQWSPRNLILFGPPGTGKTRELQRILRESFGPIEKLATDAKNLREMAEGLSWFKVVALALHDLGGRARVAQVKEHPLVQAKNSVSPRRYLKNAMWATLQEHTVQESKTVHYSERTEPLVFDKESDGTWRLATDLPDDLRDLVPEIFGADAQQPLTSRFTFVTFHQSFSYEDFVEGIRPNLDEDGKGGEGKLAYKLAEGILLEAALNALALSGYRGSLHDFCTTLTKEQRKEQTTGKPQYALAIDEINRGNVSRIFGELISQIESSKRLGESEELIVTLPYSRNSFGVPANLCFIGTMNTADRSIESLDTALRRRFQFREMRPDYDQLAGLTVQGIDVGKLLARINARLAVLRDRDHQIGHAYFWPLKKTPTLPLLHEIFQNEIIPLLQEYFYSDYSKLALVLGLDFVRKADVPSFPNEVATDLVEDLRNVQRYELLGPGELAALPADVFKKIYEP